MGEGAGDIDRGETGHCTAARSDEERIHEGDPTRRGPRQHEQSGPPGHERDEPVDYEARGRKPPEQNTLPHLCGETLTGSWAVYPWTGDGSALLPSPKSDT